MTEQSFADSTLKKIVCSVAVSPFALFPLMALLTYDWRAVPSLCSPPLPHSNWFGALGDNFACYGYLLFGLAIWIVPVIGAMAALCVVLGRKVSVKRRAFFFGVFLVAASCTLQVLGKHGGPVDALREHVNTPAAGGVIGYLLMTKLLSALLNDFGSAVVSIAVMFISLVAAVGARNFAGAVFTVLSWAKGAPQTSEMTEEEKEAEKKAMEAAMRAKEEVKRQRAEEKEKIRRMKAEKAAAKAAAKAAMKAGDALDAIHANSRETPARAAADTPAKIDKGPYVLPPVSLLNPVRKSTADHGDVKATAKKLVDTLTLFDINTELAYTVEGPVVTKYALTPEPGTRAEKFRALQDTLKMALKAKTLRIEAPIPGEDKIGFEIPNPSPAGVSFREIFESKAWTSFKGELPLLFGRDAAGRELVADLAAMPHLLVAGATGQGKSVCLNSLINGLLMTKTPAELKLIMVDPKSVEFSAYASIPHLIVPVITENKKVMVSLQWAVNEMEKRLKLFARTKPIVRNIYDFNHRPNITQTDFFGHDEEVTSDAPRTLPYIVIIIDEVADLMASNGKEVTPVISRIAAKARAAGIHLILATQRPDAKIITGTIKANIPGRVAFKTSSAIDSRTILDDSGAESLIGRGDMLFKMKDDSLMRAQGAWISDEEISNVISFIEEHSTPEFNEAFTKKLQSIKEENFDPLADDDEASKPANAAAAREKIKDEEAAKDFRKALECIMESNRASTSFFQRRMQWGYNHASRILDMLEDAGVVGPQPTVGPRQILMDESEIQALLQERDGDTEPAAGQDEPAGEEMFSNEEETI